MTVRRRALPMWLTAVLISAVAGCGTGTSPKHDQVEERLHEIAAEAERPVYYLGPRFRDWSLTEVGADDTGRVDAIYGTCLAVVDGCSPPLEVINQPLDFSAWSMAVGCTRLPPVRGVPTMHFGGALVLLTGDSLVTVAVTGDDTATAVAATEQLREVGAELSRAALPPPDAPALQAIEAACGKNPGDTGRREPDEGPEPVGEMQVPDFTVGRLGGGDLRWGAYLGKPVVVVVGDVPHVLTGIKRVLALTPGSRPAVIGLVWKPFGSKDAPAPIAEIEQEAGQVAVPVGYAAIPRPAVWFFDMAEVDAAQSGVIAFVNADGTLIRHVRTDAPDSAIADALGRLAR
ncbi:hypothetical protein Q2K19_30520 [Micromonospora soli]|uniref:hypothetical protein n=1 Tax=Micromonospora sp. NBRC 110009 TaxID=3061627 RepID=UPI002671F6D8|nr:hypothetical protein [Micromonospora sp. NBRC 110009]WKT98439.1 hypothetical protein Q2K19_30520 [Micromonospora sp. NBRC 110009]